MFSVYLKQQNTIGQQASGRANGFGLWGRPKRLAMNGLAEAQPPAQRQTHRSAPNQNKAQARRRSGRKRHSMTTSAAHLCTRRSSRDDFEMAIQCVWARQCLAYGGPSMELNAKFIVPFPLFRPPPSRRSLSEPYLSRYLN